MNHSPLPSVTSNSRPSALESRWTYTHQAGNSPADFSRQLEQAGGAGGSGGSGGSGGRRDSASRPENEVKNHRATEVRKPSPAPRSTEDEDPVASSQLEQTQPLDQSNELVPVESELVSNEVDQTGEAIDAQAKSGDPDGQPQALIQAQSGVAGAAAASSMSVNHAAPGSAQASDEEGEMLIEGWSNLSPAQVKASQGSADSDGSMDSSQENFSTDLQAAESSKSRASGQGHELGFKLAGLDDAGGAKVGGMDQRVDGASSALVGKLSEGSGAAHTVMAQVDQPTAMEESLLDDASQANVARVARGLQTAMQQRGGTVTLRLDPPELGAVKIQMQVQEGQVSARFMVQSESVSTLLTHRLSQLRHALEGQGLSVDRLEVITQPSPSNGAFSQGSQGQAGNSPGTDDGRSRGQFARQESAGGSGGWTAEGTDDSQDGSRDDFQERLRNLVA